MGKKSYDMATIKYLLTQDSDSRWGLTINTIGIQDIAAGSVYPVGDHPEDYQFSASQVNYDPKKPCYWQILSYQCDTAV